MIRAGILALVALALAVPAAAAAADVRVGLHPESYPDADLARMGAGGVEVMRLPLDWRLVEPTEGAPFDFTEHDRIIGSAAKAGIQVLPLIGVSTPWAAATPAEQPRRPEALDQHDAFVRAMVDRYKPGGAFWLANPALPQLPLTEWQIWNEPNLIKHWTGRRDPKAYARFLERIRGVVLDEDPEAEIVLAGMPQFHQEYPCIEYLTDLYEIKGVRRLFDTVAVNAYMRRTKGLHTAMRRLRALMDKNGDEDKDIWITEMGWASDGPKRNEAVTDVPGQAANLAKGFRLLRSKGPRYGLTTAVWYTWRDHVQEPHIRDRFWFHNGLFGVNGQPKPSWFAFTDFTGGDPGVGPLP
jgi:hypothetical protein